MGFDLRATKEVKDSEKQQREGRKVREGVGKVESGGGGGGGEENGRGLKRRDDEKSRRLSRETPKVDAVDVRAAAVSRNRRPPPPPSK